jgi:sec-independent protein translocase protein TatB
MFDIGWTEMLVIAVVMIVVVGPKDLPKMLRTFGRTTAKMRAMAGDFQKQFNEALREAELEDVKKSVDSLKSLNPAAEIRKQLNPLEKAAADVRSGLDAALKPTPKPADAAAAVAKSAEPLKNGATAMPAAQALPEAPATPAVAAPAAAAVAAAPIAPMAPAAAAAPAKPAEPEAMSAAPMPAATAATKPRARTSGGAKPAAAKAAAPRAAKKKTADGAP